MTRGKRFKILLVILVGSLILTITIGIIGDEAIEAFTYALIISIITNLGLFIWACMGKTKKAINRAEEAKRKAEEANRTAKEANRKAEMEAVEAYRKAKEARRKAKKARRKADEEEKRRNFFKADMIASFVQTRGITEAIAKVLVAKFPSPSAFREQATFDELKSIMGIGSNLATELTWRAISEYLNCLPGVGPKIVENIIAAYPSEDALSGANMEDLLKIPGLSKNNAEKIKQRFSATAREDPPVQQGLQTVEEKEVAIEAIESEKADRSSSKRSFE